MHDLVQIVDAALADSVRRSGNHLACRLGCTQCCIGPFPISQQDAARLREGFERLTATDPSRAARVRLRVAQSIARLDLSFPGDPASGILDPHMEDFDDFANNEPCPVLDPVTGACDLYASRPIVCRTFGPPMRTPGDDGEINLATCELCFTHATAAEIAGCEVDPALAAVEASSNHAFDREHCLHGETIVAYAFDRFMHRTE